MNMTPTFHCANYRHRLALSHLSLATPRYFRLSPSDATIHKRRNFFSLIDMPDGTDTSHVNMSETRYQITTDDNKHRWIRISFSDVDDTTSAVNNPKKKKGVKHQSNATTPSEEPTTQQTVASTTNTFSFVPESVLQYERSLRKVKAADRASKTKVTIHDHLQTIYFDKDIVVTNKPSGILCVPGVNHYRSLLDLVYEVYGGGANPNDKGISTTQQTTDESAKTTLEEPLQKDSMIAHRLDMDTSGIVVFARTRLAMSKLHKSFRERTGTRKRYEALLVGWLDTATWASSANNSSNNNYLGCNAGDTTADTDLGGGEINLPLQRDHKHPPFMRVSTPESEVEAAMAVRDLNHAGWKKLVAKRPKPSTTQFRILAHEVWMDHPITRVELTPITGRTHQLRVHCAAIGHPILGDPAYGWCGEAHPNGGFCEEVMRQMSPTCAGMELQRDVEESVQASGRTMCLHARRLGFHHPATDKYVEFEALPSF